MKSVKLILFILYSTILYSQEYFDSSNFETIILKDKQGKLAYATLKFGQDIKESKLITPYDFDWAEPFNNEGYAKVEINKKYGIIDTLGNVIIPIKVDFISHKGNGFFIAKNNNKYGAFDKNGVLKIPFEYDYISFFDEFGNASAVLNEKWGVINSVNEIILPFEFKITGWPNKGFRRGFLNGWLLYDKNGIQVLNKDFISIDDVKGNIYSAILKDGISVVIVDSNGDRLIQDNFLSVYFHPTKEIAIVKNYQGKHKLLDLKQKKYLNEIEYDLASFNYDDKIEIAMFNDDYDIEELMILDLSGKKINQQNYDFIICRKNGGYLVTVGQKRGILDNNFNTVIPIIYGNENDDTFQDLTMHLDRIYAYKENEGWGMLDGKGNIILPFRFINADLYYKNLCPFKSSGYGRAVKDIVTGKVGLLDKKGNWLIKLGLYDDIGSVKLTNNFHLLVEVTKNGKKGVFDLTENKEIIKPTYDKITGIFKYHIEIEKNKKQGLILLESLSYFNPSKFEYLDFIKDLNQIIIRKDNNLGVISLNGNIVIETLYEKIVYNENEKCYSVYRNNKAGFIDEKGKTIIPLTYDSINCPNSFSVLEIPTFHNNASFVRYENKSILIDINNQIIITQDNFKLTDISSSCFPILNKIKFGKSYCFVAYYNNSKGESLTEVLINGNSYDNFGGDISNSSLSSNFYGDFNFYFGLIAARKNGKYGYLDLDGNEVIPFNFEKASNFYDGLATVKINEKYYKINEKGQLLNHIDGEIILYNSFEKK